jgi:hypothetical protein
LRRSALCQSGRPWSKPPSKVFWTPT